MTDPAKTPTHTPAREGAGESSDNNGASDPTSDASSSRITWRRPAHLWKPGQSGNPGGRPEIQKRIRELAKRRSVKAFNRIVALIDSPDESVSLAASRCVLKIAGVDLEPRQAPGRPLVNINMPGSNAGPEAFETMTPGAIHSWLVSNTQATPEDFARAQAVLERHAAAERERASAVEAEVIAAPAAPAERAAQSASDSRVEPPADDGLAEWRALGAAAAQPAPEPAPVAVAPHAPPPQEIREEDIAALARPNWGRE